MSSEKWSVYEIGGDYFAAPDQESAVGLLKQMCGFSDPEIEEMGVEALTESELSKPIRDEDTQEIEGTIAEARDVAQKAGKPSYLCSENL